MRSPRVLHLVGSPTSDFFCDLSEVYARGCIAALEDPARYAFSIAYVSPDGTWRFPKTLDRAAIDAARPLALAEALAHLAGLAIDVAVPQMFCLAGMTHYRALLDVLGVPYLGNGPLQMSVAADKAMTRAIVAAAGVDVPEGELVRRGERPRMAPPVVVKPSDADNSDGVSLVTSPAGFPAALAEAFAHSRAAVVERFVPLGREVRCGVVERGGELVCLPLEEYFVHPETRPIRRRVDKLRPAGARGLTLAAKDAAESWIVALDDPIVAPVWEMARRSYTALGCRQYGLFDFRIDPAGRPWFLEAGLYCSFAPQSVIVTMMEAAGTPLAAFFADAVRAAIGDARALPTPVTPS